MSNNISDIPEITSRAEARYITKRKIKAMLNSICFYICRLFPIKNNLISVCTFEGKGGFGCNPKYLVQELHRRNPDYEFVWFVNDLKKEFPDYIKKVPNTSWSRAFWLSRSKLWIDNYRKPYGTIKRKGQYYINVNHYTIALKCVGLWRGKGFSRMAYIVSKNDSDMIDGLVIDSAFCEEALPKGMVYDGRYLKTGAPRCDVLYGDRTEYKRAFRKKHKISEEAQIVMFAPTFREGAKDGVRKVYSEIWSIDFLLLMKTLKRRFGGEWYLCIRVHPQLAEAFEDYMDEDIRDHIINESRNDDMYEILAGVDAYITDYSSACFEAAAALIPVFMYADDISQYTKDRGALFWDMREDNLTNVKSMSSMLPNTEATLPFSIAVNNKQLEDNIIEFDQEKYAKRVEEFYRDTKLVFDGMASSRLADSIEKMIGDKV